MFDLLLFFPKNHNLWLFSIWSLFRTLILLRILFTALRTLSWLKPWRWYWKYHHPQWTPYQIGLKNMRELSLLFQSLTKTSLVTTQTQVKQLGAAFSGTQTRPLVNFAYFYEMVFQSKDYSFGPSQHYGSLSFHVHKCFSKNNPATSNDNFLWCLKSN